MWVLELMRLITAVEEASSSVASSRRMAPRLCLLRSDCRAHTFSLRGCSLSRRRRWSSNEHVGWLSDEHVGQPSAAPRERDSTPAVEAALAGLIRA